MKTPIKKVGRPVLESGRREHILKAKLTEEEHQQVMATARELGISRTELIRTRLLSQQGQVLVNTSELLASLDNIGSELGRSGNNINQLARHANVLNKRGMLEAAVISEFNGLFSIYQQQHLEIQQLMRLLIRLMKG
ncbi:plasmid mobilization relaxosome protein MobC [Pedobacter chinensis]|uniref:Plasmid mobilization relaxosome protein MobC n=1 Tax=Pedobacter chinensis TaxID=2282421 RepID=A0A369PPV3_9SPHI|nr:plasmid mobilization relaxosome protein MobC [Pedobacter chinensis]RDC54322.1 plasmid mobilization relaxosome protein MobC [Pedobacter chinensis]